MTSPVVTTAGHVDHGKSTLVRTLTGTDPDRLDEERRRGRSIVLGHAVLPGDPPVPLVDVPGHRDHVGAALGGLAALGRFGAALLVVAADDGWMPQTADHAAALAALDVSVAAIVVTRADRVSAGRRADVAADVVGRLVALGVRSCGPPSVTADGVTTVIGAWPVLAVDARDPVQTRAVAELLHDVTLRRAVQPSPVPIGGPLDLWVDRVFSPPGVGPVVTGTLAAGSVAVGDQLVDSATGADLLVRGLQRHGQDVPHAAAPSRVAVHLRARSGPTPRPGSRLRADHAVVATARIDAAVRPIRDATGSSVFPRADGRGAWSLHVGSARSEVRIELLAPLVADEGVAMASLLLSRALPMASGDRFVIRDLGMGRVVGGGEVLDPGPPDQRRGRPARSGRAAALRAVATAPPVGRPAALVASRGGWVDAPTAAQLSGRLVAESMIGPSQARPPTLDPSQADPSSGGAPTYRSAVRPRPDRAGPAGLVRIGHEVATDAAVAELSRDVVAAVTETGGDGHDPSALAVADAPSHRVAAVVDLLIADGRLRRHGGRLVRAAPDAGLLHAAGGWLDAALRDAGWSGLDRREVTVAVGVPERLAGELLDDDRWVIADGRVLHRDGLDAVHRRLAALAASLDRGITVAEARDVLGGSRRLVLPVLAALDAQGATRRHGDLRVVTPPGLLS